MTNGAEQRIDTLRKKAEAKLLDLKLQEVKAQWKVHELRKAKVIDAKKLGNAFGKLVEIRCQGHQVLAGLFAQEDSLLKERPKRTGVRQMPPPDMKIPTPTFESEFFGVNSGCWTITYIGGTYIEWIWSSLIDDTFVLWFTDGSCEIGHWGSAT